MLGKTTSKGYNQDATKYKAGTPSQPQEMGDVKNEYGVVEGSGSTKYSGAVDGSKGTKYTGSI